MHPMQSIGRPGNMALSVGAQSWLADVERRDQQDVWASIHSSVLGVLPSWRNGLALECAIRLDDTTYAGEAHVVEQFGERIHLRLVKETLRPERRAFLRVLGGFEVHYRTPHREGFGTCFDLSAGGMRIRIEADVEPQAAITLWFRLPGEDVPIRTEGIVLRVDDPDDGHPGRFVGVKFASLRPSDGVRIAAFCQPD